MDKVKILWSGITGRTGIKALESINQYGNIEIVAGLSRNNSKYYNYNELDKISEDFDIIVDFSHKECFDKILDFAIKVNKPLISGTSGLKEEQLKRLEEAASIIPIFRGGNFRRDVKKFIDEVIQYAEKCDETNIILTETHYKTKKIPSETARVIVKKVFKKTGKNVEIKSYLKYDELICEWQVADIFCRVVGFKELAEDVLEISLMMNEKKAVKLYDLDDLI